MAKIDSRAGMTLMDPIENWEPTLHLAFFKVPLVDRAQPELIPTATLRILHQLWRSNIGRQIWRQVPEMDPNDPDNE